MSEYNLQKQLERTLEGANELGHDLLKYAANETEYNKKLQLINLVSKAANIQGRLHGIIESVEYFSKEKDTQQPAKTKTQVFRGKTPVAYATTNDNMDKRWEDIAQNGKQ